MRTLQGQSLHHENGLFKDETSDYAQDGTELVERNPLSDLYYAVLHILQRAGINPNELRESPQNSQLNAALDVLYALSGHTHAANEITSGALPVVRGGTGRTSIANVRANLGSTTAANALATDIGITGTLPAANVGNLDASKITSGTFANARISSAERWEAKAETGQTSTPGALNVLDRVTLRSNGAPAPATVSLGSKEVSSRAQTPIQSDLSKFSTNNVNRTLISHFSTINTQLNIALSPLVHFEVLTNQHYTGSNLPENPYALVFFFSLGRTYKIDISHTTSGPSANAAQSFIYSAPFSVSSPVPDSGTVLSSLGGEMVGGFSLAQVRWSSTVNDGRTLSLHVFNAVMLGPPHNPVRRVAIFDLTA